MITTVLLILSITIRAVRHALLKNLKAGETPSCFFNKLDPEKKEDRGEYLHKDFARIVMKLYED